MAQTSVHLVTRHPCARSASFGHRGLVASFMKKDVFCPVASSHHGLVPGDDEISLSVAQSATGSLGPSVPI